MEQKMKSLSVRSKIPDISKRKKRNNNADDSLVNEFSEGHCHGDKFSQRSSQRFIQSDDPSLASQLQKINGRGNFLIIENIRIQA